MMFLVTGGAGFIGSCVVRQLLENSKFSVVNIDSLTYSGNLESLKDVSQNDRYHFEKIDIRNKSALVNIFKKYKPDVVMHLAAESHVDRSIEGPENFLSTNIIGTFNLLEVAKEYWSDLLAEKKAQFRFHHISTDEVYGDLEGHGKSSLFTENTPYNPSSPYSASKASSDHFVRAWNRTYKLPTIITNCSNNYGPFQFPEKLIPHVILNAIHGKPIPVYGNGMQIRDWLFVEDHVKALILVATNGVIGETYNIGGHNEKTNIEVIKAVCNLLETLAPKKPAGVKKYLDLINYVDDRPGHDLRYAIDASKIYNDLGWMPIESFESGIEKTVNWYLKNNDWWIRVLSGEYKLERIGSQDEKKI